MRILQLSSARAFGGGERHLADLASALQERGHEVYAALTPRSPLVAELRTLPTENIITLPLRNALDLKSALRLARFIRERRIEIVHAHMGRDYTLAALAVRRASSAAHLPAPRFIITRHVLFPLGRIHRLTLSGAACVIAVSHPVARALAAQGIFHASKLRVVANAVDVKRFDSALRDFRRDDYRRVLQTRAPFLVGTLGEISRLKGQSEFVCAAAIIARRSAVPVDFIIVGEDASKTGKSRAALEALIAAHGLQERIRLLGRRADVAQILASLDVFVSSSRSESFGLAIIEAMACGAAVVATATEGAREIIEDGFNGRLVPIGDAETLATTILRLLEDAAHRASLTTHAREQVLTRWNLERMVDETERIYQEAAGVCSTARTDGADA